MANHAPATTKNLRGPRTHERLGIDIKAALADGASLSKAAELLNERNIASPMGARWHAPSLLKAAKRLGLR
jgi:hypothetical protein